jgi:hypothetical protein
MPHEFTEWEHEPEPLASSAHSGSPPRKLTGIGTLEPTEPPKKPTAVSSWLLRGFVLLILVGLIAGIVLMLLPHR